MDNNIKFTMEDTKEKRLPFLDGSVHIEEDRSLNTKALEKASYPAPPPPTGTQSRPCNNLIPQC